ncbi:PREDICTED: SHC-transforming protein 1-like [Priapulus caudatus]|uniref:SHC-transforming protein 1-like n=1 Tax=Priapulus caudatus TaxID=37621 RepID=A0ABM1E9Z4_PRICU|nr:PREDICTED: SHC-transforming protein 1-like [Priapulus caudatus]
MLAERPNMIHAGSNINFTISTDNLGLVIMESGEIIATHQMQGISFASGGDLDTQDFVAYVAKDGAGRACYVMECTGGLAQDVITTIGQAFELRFKEYLRKTTKTVKLHRAELRGQHGRPARTGVGAGRVSDDAHSQSPPPLPARTHRIHRQALCRRLIEANQVSDLTNENNGLAATDMIDSLGDQEQVMPPPPPIRSDSHRIHTRVPLDSEAWFHRNVTRSEAERLIREDGDFLVRESSQSDGQYVLTGMQRGTVKHLLLVDNDGVVRTRDRVFESVVHLIDYHRQNQLPIMSTDSATSLVNPVLCQQCQPDPR